MGELAAQVSWQYSCLPSSPPACLYALCCLSSLASLPHAPPVTHSQYLLDGAANLLAWPLTDKDAQRLTRPIPPPSFPPC
jgi:hypothetical protein